MAKRQATPDILSDVLSSETMPATSTDQSSAKDDVNAEAPARKKKPARPAEKKAEAASPPAGKAKVTRQPSKRSATPSSADASEEKHKATFYLPQSALDELEEVWLRLRRLTRGSKGSVSKSGIVEVALQAALEDFAAEGEDSTLAKALLE